MDKKLTVIAAAALAFSLSMAPTEGVSVTIVELTQMNAAIAAGDANLLLLLIQQNPGLLNLPGALGDALRTFASNPSLGTIATVNASVAGLSEIEIAQSVGIY